jgi:hypothetical protein
VIVVVVGVMLVLPSYLLRKRYPVPTSEGAILITYVFFFFNTFNVGSIR